MRIHIVTVRAFLLVWLGGWTAAQAQMTLASTPNPSQFGQTVTLTATVPGGSLGVVTFYDGTMVLGGAAISSGQAKLTTLFLQSGTRSLRALASNGSSATLPHTVVSAPLYGFRPFQQTMNYPDSVNTRLLVLADFNMDGKADLGVVDSDRDTFHVSLGKGDGTFQSATTNTTSDFTLSLTAGDFNGDGIPDVAIGSESGVALLRGNGDGTFLFLKDIPTPNFASGIAIGDFNGDGIADMAVSGKTGVSIFLGTGNFTFTLSNSYATTSRAQSIALGDFNADGKADLATATADGTAVLTGNGDGTFHLPAYYGHSQGALAVGDFNGDGKLDLAAIGISSNILLGNGDATFQVSALSSSWLGNMNGSLVTTDIDGDGKLDLLFTDLAQLLYSRGKGNGTFFEPVRYSSGTAPFAVVAGDLNGDGRVDAIVGTNANGQISVLLGYSSKLSVSVTHAAGNIFRGTNVPFTLAVGNDAAANPTAGLVTVTPAVSDGLTLSSLSGTGWDCSATSCTRSDVLNPGSGYPPILASVFLAGDAPPLVKVQVSLIGGGSVAANAADSIVIPGSNPGLLTPANAAAGIPLSTSLTWVPALDATSYDIYFGTSSSPLFVASTTTASYLLSNLAPCTTYYWRVAVGSGDHLSSPVWSFTTGPSVVLSPTGASFPSVGGFGSFQVAATGACAWTAVSGNPDWVAITSLPSATGQGSVSYSVAATATARTGTISVSGITFTISQSAQCQIAVTNRDVVVDATAQIIHVDVTATPGCSWTPTLLEPAKTWLTLSPVNGSLLFTGNSTIDIAVAANAYVPGASSNVARMGFVTVGGINISVTQRQTVTVFADVPPSYSFFDFINLLRGHSITDGCLASPLSYCPEAFITRGEMAVFIVRSIMGGDTFAYNNTPYFDDVPTTHSFFKWIQKMKELGITSGCQATLYCPQSAITRGETAVFVIRARLGAATVFNYPAAPYFSDVPASNSFFPYIQKLRQTGITVGCDTLLYCPDGPITRAQMAVFVVRGEFNQAMPPDTPMLLSAAPTTALRGQTLTVTINSSGSHFDQALTQVSAGAGVTVNTITVANASTLSVSLTIAANAAQGARLLTVTTGNEELSLPNTFFVQ